MYGDDEVVITPGMQDYIDKNNEYLAKRDRYIRDVVKKTRVFFDNLQRIWRATDLGRIKSVATIPAISTHQQQGAEGRTLANIQPNMVRLCVGGEHADDVISDLDQALLKTR